MEIIATTKDGCLIQATAEEVKEILNAVSGQRPKELKIGQKIPAIDYASTIKKVKSLAQTHAFTTMVYQVEKFNREMEQMKNTIEDAGKIEV